MHTNHSSQGISRKESDKMLFMLPKGYERQTINWCGNEPKLPRIQAQPQQLPGFAEKSKEPNSLAGKALLLL